MTILKIACIGFSAVFFCTMLRNEQIPFANLISISACFLIIFYSLTKLSSVFEMLRTIQEYTAMQDGYYRILLKIIGITYVADFSSSICQDAGYKAIAGQIEVFGKISVLAVSTPIILALLETISSLL